MIVLAWIGVLLPVVLFICWVGYMIFDTEGLRGLLIACSVVLLFSFFCWGLDTVVERAEHPIAKLQSTNGLKKVKFVGVGTDVISDGTNVIVRWPVQPERESER